MANEEVKRLTFSIDPSTHKMLQVLSKMNGRSMNRHLEYEIRRSYQETFGDTDPNSLLKSQHLILERMGA